MMLFDYDDATALGLLEEIDQMQIKSDPKAYAFYLCVKAYINYHSDPESAMILFENSIEEAEKINFSHDWPWLKLVLVDYRHGLKMIMNWQLLLVIKF